MKRPDCEVGAFFGLLCPFKRVVMFRNLYRKIRFMQNTTPQIMTIEEFNSRIKSWTVKTRSKMAGNAPKATGELASSLSYAFKKNFGHISTINYKFQRYGVFIHYGVGRGYIRSGNSVIRGSRNPKSKIDPSTGFKRPADDWFDVEIRTGLIQVAEITRDFYGDMAMNQLLEKLDKFLIQKPK